MKQFWSLHFNLQMKRISISLPRLRYVSQPVHVIGLAISAHSGIFVNKSGIIDVTTRFLDFLGWQSNIIFSNLHFCILNVWVVTMEVPLAVFMF